MSEQAPTVSLVSYGLGNLGSVLNMLKRAGADARLVTTPDEILASDRVLLPGIGAFDEGMTRLRRGRAGGIVPSDTAVSVNNFGIVWCDGASASAGGPGEGVGAHGIPKRTGGQLTKGRIERG